MLPVDILFYIPLEIAVFCWFNSRGAVITDREYKSTDKLVAIVGPEIATSTGPRRTIDVLFTFLSGEPTFPDRLVDTVTADMIGNVITVSEAKELGIRQVTIVQKIVE